MSGGGGSGGGEKFCLKWNEFESNVSTAFRELREDKDFFDVTLACDGNQLEAHKVILSACSPFFRGVLKRNPHAHPLLYLKGIKYEDILAVLNFMYHGEVNIAQEELNSFLAVAEELQVKGLTQGGSAPSHPLPKRAPDPPRPPKTQIRQPVVPRPTFEATQGQQMEVAEVGSNIKTEPQQQVVDLGEEEEAGTMAEYGEEEEYQYGGQEQDYHYQEELARQGLGEAGAAGQDRSILLEYIVKREDGVAGWVCTVCGKGNMQKSNVLSHVESAHFPGTFIYTCVHCAKKMNTKNALNIHIRREHKQRIDPFHSISTQGAY